MTTRAAAPKSNSKPSVEVRAERYRIRFDKRADAAKCARIAGACRLVWNLLLADCERRYRLPGVGGAGRALKRQAGGCFPLACVQTMSSSHSTT